MKVSELKNIIKTAVKEAIQEELKDVLYEAFKNNHKPQINESYTPQPKISGEERKKLYEDAIGETISFNSTQAQTYMPSTTTDPVNGQLPPGEVSMNQIMGILNK